MGGYIMFFFFYFDKPYVAIIGDIVQSKKLNNRDEVQKKLHNVLSSINTKYSDYIASNFMITLGDEFQGLLKSGESILNIINEIENKMSPVQIRFGIGIGEITTDINRDIPLGTDGPAYHNARKMIDNLKSMEKKAKIGNTNIMIASQGENSNTDILLNSIFLLCSTIKSKWSSRQREIVLAYIESDNSQIKTAEKLGIKQSSVNKGLSNAGYYSYKSAIKAVTNALSDIKVTKDV
jgi:hypothetical protein